MDDVAQTDRPTETLYDRDLAAWAIDQAARIRRAAAGDLRGLDWDNLAEEIEALARSDRRELSSHILTVAEHLMKLKGSPANAPRGGWVDTVDRSRIKIAVILEESPSLRREVDRIVAKQLAIAQRLAGRALSSYGETPLVPVATLNFTPEQIIGEWWPDAQRSHSDSS